MIVFLILNIYIDNATRLTPGVQSNGLGGIVSLIDEGLSVFHNPAINSATKFNFALGRWLYNTNVLQVGASYKKYTIGIHYLNYGSIQGYNEFGLPTDKFSPYDLNFGIGKSFGLFGVCLKNFQSRIDSLLFIGVIGGISSYVDFGVLKIGAKIDNIGIEFNNGVDIPLILASGAKIVLPDNFEIYTEIKGREFELSSGILYRYENLKVFAGLKYINPQDYVEKKSFHDFHYSGGLTISFEEYEIDYSFLYTQYSTAHLIGIIFTP